MRIKKVKGKFFLWSKGCGEIKSIQDFKEAYSWRVRCNKHKRWETISRFIIKKLTMAVLKRSSIYRKHIERYGKPPEIKRFKVAQKRSNFKRVLGEYYTDTRYYSMAMQVAEYSFPGESEFEVYLAILNTLILKSIMFPFC